MSRVQHQPGDHVLVEAVVVESADEDQDYYLRFVAENAGDPYAYVRAADVRPLTPATPDAGGYTEAELLAAHAVYAARRPGNYDTALVAEILRVAALVRASVRKREEAARTAPAPDHPHVTFIDEAGDAPCMVCGLGPDAPHQDDEPGTAPAPDEFEAWVDTDSTAGTQGTAPAPVDDERVERAVAVWMKHWEAMGMPLDRDRAEGMRAVLAADDAYRAGEAS